MQSLASLRFVALLLVTSPALFAACGGDDDTTSGSAGSAGHASAGHTSGGSAGSGHAGSTSNVGGDAGDAGGTTSGGKTSSGGTISGGGKIGAGGAPTCEINECLRANVCLDKCGGSVVYTGCCACEAPTVDELSCGAGGAGPGGSSTCVGMTCAPGQTCVAHRTVGGAQIPPDAGSCPNGRHVESNTCRNDFQYTCAPLVGCAMPSPTCQCAEASKCGYTDGCMTPYKAAWLDTDADLVCEQHAP